VLARAEEGGGVVARGIGGVDGGDPEALRSSRVRKSFCFCSITISILSRRIWKEKCEKYNIINKIY
jgi:hypothetical protein